MDEEQMSLERAHQSYRAGKPLEAVKLYEESIASGCQLPARDRIRAGEAYAAAGDTSTAIRLFCSIVDGGSPYSLWLAATRGFSSLPESSFEGLARKVKVAVLGTWNTTEFAQYFRLAAARCGISVTLQEAPFDQYFNYTLDSTSELYRGNPDVVLLCPDYRAVGLGLFTDSPASELENLVSRWCLVWEALRKNSSASIIQQGIPVPSFDALGHIGTGLGGSRTSLLGRLNVLLAQKAQKLGIAFVHADGIAAKFGKADWFDDRNWYWAKIAMSSRAFPELARHTSAVLAATLGLSRRCLILDLDNTLWGGVIGDDGLGGIKLGGGADGEAFKDFQRVIKSLGDRGIVLAVCSKNTLEIAQEPFKEHPEMILKLDDIAVFEAGWDAKSVAIERISSALDLGLSSLTFVDDNPYEREQVRQALPQVDVIDLPEDVASYARVLLEYPYFEMSSFTAEDRSRGEQYRARGALKQLHQKATSLEEYQSRLNMVATIGPVNEMNIERVVQLINKTNQFNLTTRRRNRIELEQLKGRDDVEILQVRLRDCFADHGLIAVAIAVQIGETVEIDTLLMSCRVIGRNVEQVVINDILLRARNRGCSAVIGKFHPTQRNALVANFYRDMGFEEKVSDEDPITWIRLLEEPMGNVNHIRIEYQ